MSVKALAVLCSNVFRVFRHSDLKVNSKVANPSKTMMQRQVLDLPRSDSEEDDEADDVLARTLLDQSQDALVTPRDNEHRASTSVLLRHELSVNSDVITRPKPSVDLDLSVMSGVDVPVTSAASAVDNRVTSVQSLMATLQTLKTTQRKVAPLSARNHRADTSLSTQQQQVEAHWSGNDVTLQDHDVSADDGEDDVIESDHDKSDDENGNDDCVHALKCMNFFLMCSKIIAGVCQTSMMANLGTTPSLKTTGRRSSSKPSTRKTT